MQDDDMDYHLDDIDQKLKDNKQNKCPKIVFLLVLCCIIILGLIASLVVILLKLNEKEDELNKINKDKDKNKDEDKKKEEIQDVYNINYDFYGTKYINLSYAIDKKIENTFKENGTNYNQSREAINNNEDYISNDRNIYDLYIPQYALKNKNNYNGIILWIHGGAWVQGRKEEINPLIRFYIQNGYIIANMGYTLLNSTYKNANIYRILDEVRACVESIKNKLKDLNFTVNKLGLGIGGASAGAHIALLYSYLMKKSPIPIKFIIDVVGPIGLDPKYFSHLKNNNEPLDSIENITVIQKALENNKIIENKGSKFLLELMNAFLDNNYSKEFINSILVNGQINKNNSNYTELLNKVKVADIFYVNDENKCPMICFYGGKDSIAGLSHFAYLNERAKGERIIKFIYSKFAGHAVLTYDNSTKETEEDGKNAVKMFNYYIYDFAKTYFKED